MRLPFTNLQLAKIASWGALFVGGNCILMRYLVMKRFHESPYFTKPAQIILNNRALVEYLGEPVKFGNPDLSDKRNYSTDSEATFEVPLKGSKVNGHMRFVSVRTPSSSTDDTTLQWQVKCLEVTVDDKPNQKVVLVRGNDYHQQLIL